MGILKLALALTLVGVLVLPGTLPANAMQCIDTDTDNW